MKLLLPLILFSCCFLLPERLYAQQVAHALSNTLFNQVHVRSFPKSILKTQGNPQIIKVDHEHQVWIGTTEGVSVYDGYNFMSYDSRHGLPGNFVTDIELSPQGTVFIATSKGVCRYTGNPAHPFIALNDIDSQFFNSCVFPLNDQSALTGDLKYAGLHPWGKAGLQPYLRQAAMQDAVLDINRDQEGNLYFTQPEQILVAKGTRLDSFRITPTLKLWSFILRGAGGAMWCTAGRLYRMERGRITDSLALPPGDQNALNYFAFPPDGRIVGGHQMLWEYHNGKWDTLLSPEWFSYPLARMAAEDDGTIWTCGDFGLVRVSLAKGVRRLPHGNDYVFTNTNGQLTAGFWSQKAAAQFAKKESGKGTIQQRYMDRAGNFWMLTDNGVYCYDGKSVRHYNSPVPEAAGEATCFSALEDHQGKLWIGTEHGVCCFDGHGLIAPYFKKEEQPYEQIYYLANGADSRLYLGGILQMHSFNTTDPGNTLHTLGKNQPLHCKGLCRNNARELWGIFGNRIKRLQTNRNGDMQLTDSLPAASINTETLQLQNIAFDSADNLWALSNGYLLVYLRQQGSPSYLADKRLIFTADDYPGAIEREAIGDILSTANGEILIRRDSAVFLLSPTTILSEAAKRPAPMLRLTAVIQNNVLTDWEALGYRLENNMPSHPAFSDTVTQLTFAFSAFTPSNQELISYEYQLEGYNEKWVNNGNSGTISFNGLPSGNYILHVRASDINNNISNIITYPFRLLPPWYRTWWAWTIWIAVGIGLISLGFVLRIRSMQRAARTQQLVLESQLKALRAQINPHFLQNTFNFLSDILLERPADEIRHIITRLSGYLRNVLDRTDESVVRLEDELEAAEEYLAINRLLFPGEFEYSISVTDDVDTIGFKVPSLLLQPLLENALKHGARQHKDGRGAIAVVVFVQASYLHITVRNALPHKYGLMHQPGYRPVGLKNTEQRLRLLFKDARHRLGFTVGISGTGAEQEYVVTLTLPYN